MFCHGLFHCCLSLLVVCCHKQNMIDNTLYLRVSLVRLFANIGGVALTIWCRSRSAPPAKSKRLSGPAKIQSDSKQTRSEIWYGSLPKSKTAPVPTYQHRSKPLKSKRLSALQKGLG